MSTKHWVNVDLVARQTVRIEIDVEEGDDVCDLTADEQRAAMDEADRWAWGNNCRIEDVSEAKR